MGSKLNPEIAVCAAQAADSCASQRPSALYYDRNSDPEAIAEWARYQSRYPICDPIKHVRLFNSDFSCGGLIVVHNVSAMGDGELLAFISRGTLVTRLLIRALAYWVFVELDLRRITLRLRGDDVKSRDYARRLGFRPEGIQRRWFADDVDGHLWGMTRGECPWIYADFTRSA
jgi:hypothetical protein